jgi:peptidoglycan/xylan/chitin deacetylase (PgdA/CDA1 family)
MVRCQTGDLTTPAKLKLLAWLCRWLGVNRLFYFLNRNRKRILTFHNVLPDALFRSSLHEGVSHSESVFRRQIAHLTSRFRFGTDLKNPRELTLTFDDGYRNQHAVVHPILMQFGIAAYFFCCLDLLSGEEPLLIDLFLLWLSYVEYGEYRIHLAPDAEPLTLVIGREADRLRCWQLLYGKLRENYIKVAPRLYEELDRCRPFAEVKKQIDPAYYRLRFTCILPQGLAAMKACGHLIGAHGKTHAPLASLDPAALDAELRACAREMGETFNTRVFCFPFGGVGDLANEVKNNGFTHALSNVNRPLPKGRAYNDFFIPRLALPNTADVAVMDFILSGAKHFLQHFRLLPRWQARL